MATASRAVLAYKIGKPHPICSFLLQKDTKEHGRVALPLTSCCFALQDLRDILSSCCFDMIGLIGLGGGNIHARSVACHVHYKNIFKDNNYYPDVRLGVVGASHSLIRGNRQRGARSLSRSTAVAPTLEDAVLHSLCPSVHMSLRHRDQGQKHNSKGAAEIPPQIADRIVYCRDVLAKRDLSSEIAIAQVVFVPKQLVVRIPDR